MSPIVVVLCLVKSQVIECHSLGSCPDNGHVSGIERAPDADECTPGISEDNNTGSR